MSATMEIAANETTQSLRYTGGLTCAIGSTDLKASIEWYQTMLGFELEYHVEEMGWCEMKSPVHKVWVGIGKSEEVKQGGNATLVFGVESVDEARAQVEPKGVKFDGETREYPGMVRLATFFDPDGNTLMFYQSLSQK